MFQTLIVGLGRAGAELHLPALTTARLAARGSGLFDAAPALAVDPAWAASGRPLPGAVPAESLADARARLDPARTVVHVCTPPLGRADTVEQVAGLGFRLLVLEKPLAADVAEAQRIEYTVSCHGLCVAVVAQWLNSALTYRLAEIVRSGRLGALKTVRIHQHKPRFARSLATSGHPTAFDVETPHGLGVALSLAGPAELVDASGADLVVGDRTLPRMGGARLTLRHTNGVRTDLMSNLAAPVRERRIELGFERGAAVGHYPLSADDWYAQLSVDGGNGFGEPEVFADEALSAFFIQSYQSFARGDTDNTSLSIALATVRLLDEAKQRCAPLAVCV